LQGVFDVRLDTRWLGRTDLGRVTYAPGQEDSRLFWSSISPSLSVAT
jgi:hypothetical protein